jgi:hypothetical protein
MKNHENTIDLKTRTVYPDASRISLVYLLPKLPAFPLAFRVTAF